MTMQLNELRMPGRDTVFSVNLKSSHGETPLRLAAQYGHDAVVKLLINQGAKLCALIEQQLHGLLVASI